MFAAAFFTVPNGGSVSIGDAGSALAAMFGEHMVRDASDGNELLQRWCSFTPLCTSALQFTCPFRCGILQRYIWGVGLLAAANGASVTSLYAGQLVCEGYLDIKVGWRCCMLHSIALHSDVVV